MATRTAEGLSCAINYYETHFLANASVIDFHLDSVGECDVTIERNQPDFNRKSFFFFILSAQTDTNTSSERMKILLFVTLINIIKHHRNSSRGLLLV